MAQKVRKVDGSILMDIREKFGGQLFDDPTEASPFDGELIMDINTALMILSQIGVGTPGFSITNAYDTWDDFLGDASVEDLEAVKTDVFMRVKLMFDPPTNGTLISMYNDQIREFEWRLQLRAESEI